MKIKKIVRQHRRDFVAIYICESCGHEHEGNGYDDANFHSNVIPKMECQACFATSPEQTYAPRGTKYPEWKQV